MSSGDTELVEQAKKIGEERIAAIRWPSQRKRRGAAGITGVVADDVPAAGGETLAKLVGPPFHRRLSSTNKHQRGCRRIAEALDAELDAVRRDELCFVCSRGGHVTTLNVRPPS
ncbi:hypothetical protein ABIB56_003330 [Glaciihabitans sp. UYNi722]